MNNTHSIMNKVFQTELPNKCNPSICRWQPNGFLLATASTLDNQVSFYDSHGTLIFKANCNHLTEITVLEWDFLGEYVALLQRNCEEMTLIQLNSQTCHVIHTGIKDLSTLLWSFDSQKVAVGSKHGNLFVLNVLTGKGEKIIGKHQECITCGSWILDDQILVLGSSERLISFTNTKTLETIKVLHLQDEPKQIIVGETYVLSDITCAIVSVLTNTDLVLVECSMMDGIISMDNTRCITFEKKSGKPLLQTFFNHFSSILIVFESGTFISLQLKSFTNQNATLFDVVCNHGTLALNSSLTNVVACAKAQTLVTHDVDGTIELLTLGHDGSIHKNTRRHGHFTNVNSMSLTHSGNILAVGDSTGIIHGYLLRIPCIYSSRGQQLAYVSSHREITIESLPSYSRSKRIFHVDVSPDMIALGPNNFVVVVSKNSIYFYQFKENATNSITMVHHVKLDSDVENIVSNDMYTIITTKSQKVNCYKYQQQSSIVQANCDQEFEQVEHSFIQNDILIYCTKKGSISLFHLEFLSNLESFAYDHECKIVAMAINNYGTAIVFSDVKGKAFMYNIHCSSILPIPDFPEDTVRIMWDVTYHNVFYAFDGYLHTYVVHAQTVRGPLITKLGNLKIDESGTVTIIPQPYFIGNDFLPLVCSAGDLTCQCVVDGHVQVISSPSSERNTTSVENLLAAFYRSLSLSQLESGWDLCLQVEEISCWKALGNKAIEMLNIDLAIRVYQKLGDACMVGSLESLRSIEDKYLICGHIAVLYGNYSLAEENFLRSSTPYTAFEMRRNLGQWREAFLLVEEYFPGRRIETALILAKDLEIVGEYENVLTVIKRALPRDYTSHMHLKDISPIEGYEALLKILAKAYLQTGDEKQGMLIARKLRDESFLHECTQNIRVCN